MKTDTIFALPSKQIGDFVFDDAVAEVFPDMISRSVPGYGSILSMIGQLAKKFVVPGSNVYDLGCSLGAASLLVRECISPSCRLHAVDNSPAMVSRLAAFLAEENPNQDRCSVCVHEADIVGFPMTDASFCLLNFTLQFVPLAHRSRLLREIYTALRPGGVLLLSEKICVEKLAAQQLLTDLHEEFKKANGYSGLEIAQKRTALENTLIPETLNAHLSRLGDAGFEVIVPWFQCFNFTSLLAVKS